MFGLIGKMKAVSGKRDELSAILLRGLREMPGNLSYMSRLILRMKMHSGLQKFGPIAPPIRHRCRFPPCKLQSKKDDR